MSKEKKGPTAIQLAKVSEKVKVPEVEVKFDSDGNSLEIAESGSLDDAQSAADASGAEGEVKINIPTPTGLVKVKNIAKVNIFHSSGKILAGCEGFCSEEDADALQKKELALKI